jgi:cobalamin biosynthesis Co2+ chelatase CbiK
VSYGTMFSLDPAQRRQEILQAQPILEKAGITPKQIAKHLRYDDIEGVFDIVEIAEARQIEIFEKMIAGYHNSGQVKYIPASDMEVAYHAEMAEAGYQYVMSNYFLEQPKEIKQAVYQHIREREEMAAKQAAPQAPAPGMGGGMPGMPPAGGPPGAPPGAIPDIGAVL